MHSSDREPHDPVTSLDSPLEGEKQTQDEAVRKPGALLAAQLSARRRANIAVGLVPVLVVLITFLFWYQTWFGRDLSDREMEQYLTNTSVAYKTQHALSLLADEIAKGNPRAARWYPQVLALSENPEPEFRLMSAWVMGQDNHSAEFHQALRRLLADSQPMVRRNAALALARFGDANGEAELRQMLQPFNLTAPEAGTLSFRLKESDEVPRGSVVARIRAEGSQPVEVRSPVEGVVERRVAAEGAKVRAGETIAVLAPSDQQVWESLRALYLVGGPESLADAERFARGAPGTFERIRQQAALTAEAIRRRARR